MRLRHIEVFHAIYTVGSVSGAAKYLHITQPTASKILKHAEDQIGFKLFRRVRGRLIPTEEAEMLYRQTQDISDRVRSLQKTVRNLQVVDQGHIRLSAVAGLGLEHIPRAIIAFQQRHPQVHFEYQTEHYDHLLTSVQQQDKDIGIVFQAQKQSGLESVHLGYGEFVCIYANQEFDDGPARIQLTDMAAQPFIGIDNSGPLGDMLNKALLETGVVVQQQLTAQTYFVARNLVALGGGVAIVDQFTATTNGVAPVQMKAFDPPIRFSVQAIYKDLQPPSKLVKNFLALVKKEVLNSRLD